MLKDLRRREREQVRRELQSSDYVSLLSDLQQRPAFPRKFSTWDEVLRFMADRRCDEDAKEAILGVIFHAHAANPDARLKTVLLAMFWPGLDAILARRKRWDADPAELWQNILNSFVQAVAAVDLERRATRLAGGIISQTIHLLYRHYLRVWRRAENEIPQDTETLDTRCTDALGVDFGALHDSEIRNQQRERLNRLRNLGYISELDHELLLRTRVENQSMRDCAVAMGLSHSMLRKRRVRAQQFLRTEKIIEKFGDFLSHRPGVHGLFY